MEEGVHLNFFADNIIGKGEIMQILNVFMTLKVLLVNRKFLVSG